MRLTAQVLTATLLTGSLLACASGYGVPQTTPISADNSAQTTTSVLPVELRSSDILAKMHAGAGGADAATFGIYATGHRMSVVNGYPFDERRNVPPLCTAGPVTSPHDIAVDRKGDLLVANGDNTIKIFKGPGLCGAELGSIADPFGYVFLAVASRDGQTIVAAFQTRRGGGGVAVCALSGGCTRHLTVPGLQQIGGVAVAPNGDCWALGLNSTTGQAALGYFAHCRHNGVLATGFQSIRANLLQGDLDIDANGNLVALVHVGPYCTDYSSALYVYSRCNPACTHVGGPFLLNGFCPTSGHLDGGSNEYIAPTGSYPGVIDIYSYSPSGIKFLYSFANGLTTDVWDNPVAFSPNSKQ